MCFKRKPAIEIKWRIRSIDENALWNLAGCLVAVARREMAENMPESGRNTLPLDISECGQDSVYLELLGYVK